jgi:hypothetical protein
MCQTATLISQLWDILEADIGDFFETVEVAKLDKDGKAATDEPDAEFQAR